MENIKNWIANSPHKTWCEEAPGNIYSSGGECDCGLKVALADVEEIQKFLETQGLLKPAPINLDQV